MMIRKLQNADMDRVAGIWLDANLRAHCFISPQYWKSNFSPVKEMLPRAEVYVYENDREIWGFIGLNGEYIEGIFVSGEMQSRGIGKRLLDFVKTKKDGIAPECVPEEHAGDSFLPKGGLQNSAGRNG